MQNKSIIMRLDYNSVVNSGLIILTNQQVTTKQNTVSGKSHVYTWCLPSNPAFRAGNFMQDIHESDREQWLAKPEL
uniref:Uncharacterized protein n=1 Tax=Arion vulgaris TaxID=1028688 RepID=A0A0B7B1V1_9EUPU